VRRRDSRVWQARLKNPLLGSHLRRGCGVGHGGCRARNPWWLMPQVCWVLARMEALGIAVDAAGLGRKAAAVRRRMEALSAAAAGVLGGRQINLGSSAQLAVVLYEELGLPPPVPQGQRDAAAGARGGAVRACESNILTYLPGRERSGYLVWCPGMAGGAESQGL
jgi:hypothetical protein